MQLSVEHIFRVKLDIKGIVQGVGFRPFVYKLANKLELVGYVLNHGSGVTVEIEGSLKNIENFMVDLTTSLPPLARIDSLNSQNIELKNESSFKIVHSTNSIVNTAVSPDISLCDDCRDEMHDPKNRRYHYPFINCTNCGPRYTIINQLPYDRATTSMHDFEMCEACRAEYEDPSNRRYHAQPISCYDCGPKLQLVDVSRKVLSEANEAVQKACDLLKQGETIALKGLGGFHLLCDATNEVAIQALRENKNRPTKPLAVMFSSIQEIEKIAKLSKRDKALILSKERPIVLVKKRTSQILADSIAPNIDVIGVFLPYTPLHELLLEMFKNPIVATSANLSDEPIIKDEAELFSKLSSVVSVALTHDREILNACDDSVVMNSSQTLTLRMARGYAPKSFYLPHATKKKVLALGANQKSTMTLAFDNNIIVSPHIGDLNSLDSFEYFLQTLETFKRFYNFEPDVIVCDKHPNYETTKWAKVYKQEHEEIELIEVQHHYAHALSCMAEYALDEKVLAFCFDGTGYGEDENGKGKLWGGEVLVATPQNYERVYHFEELSLLGGEKAVKEPKRVGLALLFSCYDLEEILAMKNSLVKSLTQEQIKVYYEMYKRGINSPKSSSVGRLFDGVYALSGHVENLGYEGESGLIMEGLSRDAKTKQHYTCTIEEDVIEYKEMIQEILQESDAALVSKKFINTLCKIIVEISKRHPELPVVLSGGVFQNGALVSMLTEAFEKENIDYYIQKQIPVNDGGISLGQAYFALYN
jgi:hydrogenase maturation protein HypF